MQPNDIPEKILKILNSINNKRAKIVIQHILEHGFITTEQLEKDYGYNHPPRAARDVRESGIPLETYRVKSKDGRSIAAYKFGDLKEIEKGKLHGRQVFSKKLKGQLYTEGAGKCYICSTTYESRYLQVDHRIPYEISGDPISIEQELTEFMLLCGSCNRAKSWSCEHCPNWLNKKSSKICQSCYWANPNNYSHITLKEIRRLDIQWEGDEVKIYEKMKTCADKYNLDLPIYVKNVIAKLLNDK